MALIGEFGAAARDESPAAEHDTFTFYGTTFAVAEKVGAMPLLRFAAVAESGTEAEDMEGLAAMHALLEDCLVAEPVTEVVEGEVGNDGQPVTRVVAHGWAQFQRVASKNKVDAEELMEVCAAVYAVVSGRPTKARSGSPAGQSGTGPTLKGPSSSVVSSPLGNVPPILLDPRVRELRPVDEVGMSLVG